MRDLNPRMYESESYALPLGESPMFKMVSAQGFEPRTHALEGRCSIQLSYAPIFFYWSGKRDSNSRLRPWQGRALPLNYSRIFLVATWKGLEPSTSSVTGWHSNQLNYQAALFFLVGVTGLEPVTPCL